MDKPIRVFIVDDNRLLREGLVAMLEEQEEIVVIGAAANGSKALVKIKELRPEVALIDIGCRTANCRRSKRLSSGCVIWPTKSWQVSRPGLSAMF